MQATSAALNILRSFPEEIQDFFWRLDKKCTKRRVELKLTSGQSINFGGGRCSGLYDSFNRQLVVALGRGWEHCFPIAIHEWNHCQQHFDPKSVWHTQIAENHAKFFQWLAGKNFSNPRVLAQSAMILERDCERRTIIEIRKKYSHIIDPTWYATRANTYLGAHAWMLKHRSWLKKSPYNRRLMAYCPPKLFKSFDEISEDLEMAMEKFL